MSQTINKGAHGYPRNVGGAPHIPKMTADDALQFDILSEASARQIADAIQTRADAGKYPSCACQPYADVFTFARWKAQGYAVRKGESALRFGSFIPATSAKPDAKPNDESKPRLYPKTLCVFCRCQVERSELRQERKEEK